MYSFLIRSHEIYICNIVFRKISNFLFNLRLIDRSARLVNLVTIKSNYHVSSKFQRARDYDEYDIRETEDLSKKLKIIQMEHKMFLEKGEIVPEEVSDEDWLKLENMTSFSERRKYFNYLCKAEDFKIKKQVIKQIKREKSLKKLEEQIGHISYGLYRNCMFILISNMRMTLIYNWFLIRAIMFSQIMVIDLDYEHLMNNEELTTAVDQIQHTYSMNKASKEPWNLYFCNAKVNSPLMRSLKLSIPNLQTPTCLVTVTEKSYLDIFPKEKIKYLCGDSHKCIQNLDHDAIYVIGGFVDKNRQGAASLFKAKKENIPAFQLPLYKYLNIKKRNLALHHVAGVLFELKSSGDWKTALKRIPQDIVNQCLEYDRSISRN